MKIVVSHYRNGFDNTVEHSSKKKRHGRFLRPCREFWACEVLALDPTNRGIFALDWLGRMYRSRLEGIDLYGYTVVVDARNHDLKTVTIALHIGLCQ